MGTIGTFGSFGIARLAIYASSAALNVTGNNIANINTTGYCRQKLDLSALQTGGSDQFVSAGNLFYGSGVSMDSLSQYRDPYMDIRYRDENTNVGQLETKLTGLNDLAFVLDEVASGDTGFGVIEAQLSELLEQLQVLSEKSGSEEYDTLVRSTAETLVQLFNSYSSQLESVAENQYDKFVDEITETNTILTQIRDLNEQIRMAGIYSDPALTLRDTRNLLIDELSTKLGIDVIYSDELIGSTTVQNLTIKLEGTDIELVNGVYCTQLFMPDTINMPNCSLDEDGNFNFDTDDASNYMYLDTNGNPTNDKSLADVWLNPGYPDSSDLRWLSSDGTPVNNAYLAGAAINPDYGLLEAVTVTEGDSTYTILVPLSEPTKSDPEILLSDDPAVVDGFEPWFGGEYAIGVWDDETGDWLKNDDGSYYILTTTNDYKFADVTDNDGNVVYGMVQLNNNVDGYYDNYYMLSLTGLQDSKGNYIKNDYNVPMSGSTLLTDTGYSGSLMANRELLTEEGEYSSLLDIYMDNDATVKRGIPYYQMALDSLAQKFADMFNEANDLMPQDIFSTNTSGVFYDKDKLLVDDDGIVVLDGNGNPMYDVLTSSDGIAITTNNMFDIDPNGDGVQTYYENYIYDSGVRDPNFVTDEYGRYLEVVERDGDTYYDPINLGTEDDPIYLTAENLTAGNLATLFDVGIMEDSYSPEEMFQTNTDGAFVDALGLPITYNGVALTLDNLDDIGALEFEHLMENGVLTDDYSSLQKAGTLFSNNSNGNDTSGITAGNISISRDWSIGSVRIVLSKEEGAGSSDNSNVLYMIGMMDDDLQYYATDVASDAWTGKNEFFKGSFQEMLTNTTSTLAQDMSTTTTLLMNYEVSALALNNQRLAVSGVDLNEEATNMMQYQKSYTAAAKLMTTLDECLEVLLNM